MSAERYRIAPESADALSRVEHINDKGVWCGPLIPASEHHRAEELGKVDVICIACGDFERRGSPDAAPPRVVREVKRLYAVRRERVAFAAAALVLESRGIDTSKMIYQPRARPRRHRGRQLPLFARSVA